MPLTMGFGRIFFQGGVIVDFSRCSPKDFSRAGPKIVKFHFPLSKVRKKTSFDKNVIKNVKF